MPRAVNFKSEMNLLKLVSRFDNDEKCRMHLEELRWPDGVRCVRCQSAKISRMYKRNQFACESCGYQFSVTAGTIFHDSHLPLRKWFIAILLICESKKGMSALQLKRTLGVAYKTAWYLCHRIREAVKDADNSLLKGIVEMDETYVGGKAKNMHKDVRARKIHGRGSVGKVAVAGVLQRQGAVIARVVTDTEAATLIPFVEERVLPSTMVYTDEWASYNDLGASGYQHRRVHHSAKVWVRGDAHTNGIEGFWSLVKNGIRGVNHSVSAKYLQTYLNEYAFRNSRRFDTTPMFESFLTQVRKSSD